jgi:DNA-3-methyladenine glycosylase
VQVARDLLGTIVCRQTADGLTRGRIVETEAYNGPEDLASHSRAGRTRRTAPMYGEVGHAYVYLVYGMHDCLNVVTYNPADARAGAVLLRALEPIDGLDQMRLRRGRPNDADVRLASGPAKLTQALAVDRTLDAHDLTTGDELWLEAGEQVAESKVSVGPRIGVDYAGEWAGRPWRFWITGNGAVSR